MTPLSEHHNILTQLRREFEPEHLLPSMTAGIVAGIMVVIVEISLASLIFTGELSGYLSQGIGLMLFGGLVICLTVAVKSSFAGAVALPQDSPAVILALASSTILVNMPDTATGQEKFLTVVAGIAFTALLTGIFFWIVGRFKLANFVRFMPFPVIGGFLSGTGWLLVWGSFGVMVDIQPSWAALPEFFHADTFLRWLPGVVFAVLILVLISRYSHFLLLPGMLVGAILVFYLILRLSNMSVGEAESQGYWERSPVATCGNLCRPLISFTYTGPRYLCRQAAWLQSCSSVLYLFFFISPGLNSPSSRILIRIVNYKPPASPTSYPGLVAVRSAITRLASLFWGIKWEQAAA
jgi:SulP family sulfate permease